MRREGRGKKKRKINPTFHFSVGGGEILSRQILQQGGHGSLKSLKKP